MQTRVQKWGNSLAVRLPKAFADQTGIKNGSEIRLLVEDGKIVLHPLKDREKQLENMLDQINESNVHSEIDFGAPAGKEFL